MTERVDIVVVGMGPGAEEIAGRLAGEGLDVIGIESTLVGGECPYWGCVPSNMMIRASNLLAEARRVPGISGSSTVIPDWSPVARGHRRRRRRSGVGPGVLTVRTMIYAYPTFHRAVESALADLES